MDIAHAVLEEKFKAFCEFVSAQDAQLFTSFQSSTFIDQQENYKLAVLTQARAKMGTSRWVLEQAGTGRIQEAVGAAIVNEALHNGRKYPNNLVYWDKKNVFSAKPRSRAFELLLYHFYKHKTKDDSLMFEAFQNEGFSYQLSAYLFFLKDPHHYLPISQERFDEIFKDLGITDFKTSRNISWENYSTYNSLIKQVCTFLKAKGLKVSLLDAHSFLWIVGNQMKEMPAGVESIDQTSQQEYDSTSVQLDSDHTASALPLHEEIYNQTFVEGKEVLRLHKAKERNRELVSAAKKARLLVDASLRCEVCSFSFRDHYGELGEGFIEAHHLVPLAQLTTQTEIKIKDLALVCANCHRMLHRRPSVTIDKLTNLFQASKPLFSAENK